MTQEIQKLERHGQNEKMNSARMGNETLKVTYHREAGIGECHGSGAGDQKSSDQSKFKTYLFSYCLQLRLVI